MNPKKFRGWCTNGCGDLIKKGSGKFCSGKCQHAYHFKARCRQLEAGQYPPILSRSVFIRKYLIFVIGEKCSGCGWAKRHSVTGNIPVEVEHIDGNWRNNSAENLTLLCPNCHSLTPTYRALNRGNGRAHRLGGRKDSPTEFAAAARLLTQQCYGQVIDPTPTQLKLL